MKKITKFHLNFHIITASDNYGYPNCTNEIMKCTTINTPSISVVIISKVHANTETHTFKYFWIQNEDKEALYLINHAIEIILDFGRSDIFSLNFISERFFSVIYMIQMNHTWPNQPKCNGLIRWFDARNRKYFTLYSNELKKAWKKIKKFNTVQHLLHKKISIISSHLMYYFFQLDQTAPITP